MLKIWEKFHTLTISHTYAYSNTHTHACMHARIYLVDEFIDLGSNVSSTESNVNTHTVKTCTAINR